MDNPRCKVGWKAEGIKCPVVSWNIETSSLTLALTTGQKGLNYGWGHMMGEDRGQRLSHKEEGVGGGYCSNLPIPKKG